MEQDLFEWLNSKTKNDSEGTTGLLLAPLDSVQPDETQQEHQEIFVDSEPLPTPTPEPEIPSLTQNNSDPSTPTEAEKLSQEILQLQQTVIELQSAVSRNENDLNDSELTEQENYTRFQESYNDDEISAYLPETDDDEFHTDDSEIQTAEPELNESEPLPPPLEPHDDPENDNTQTETDDTDSEPIPSDHEWQERATGFTLSLDEPPPELWTNLNTNDDDEQDYEETDSLQGAAYIPIHGRNFTERLHHTLKHRKERAVQRAEAEREAESSHPYIQKTVIFCVTMLMALGFAYLALWFIGRETPEGLKARAAVLSENGEYEKAEEIYRKGYRRYPDDKFFIEAVAETARKAGHFQTAEAALNESVKHKSDNVKVQPKQQANTEPLKQKIQPEVKHEHIIPLKLREKPLTFDDYLNEGNHAYNIGMYNRSVINFFRAMEINGRDIRPYIGLSNAYRMKGMYFDSKRILDEARRKFYRNPDVETGYIFLREAK